MNDLTNNNNSEVWNCVMNIIKNSIEKPDKLIASIEQLICIKQEYRKIIQSTNVEGEERLKALLENYKGNKSRTKKYQTILLVIKGDGCDPSQVINTFNHNSSIHLINLTVSSTVNEETISSTIDVVDKKCGK